MGSSCSHGPQALGDPNIQKCELLHAFLHAFLQLINVIETKSSKEGIERRKILGEDSLQSCPFATLRITDLIVRTCNLLQHRLWGSSY